MSTLITDISSFFIVNGNLVYCKGEKIYAVKNELDIPERASRFYENGVFYVKHNNVINIVNTEQWIFDKDAVTAESIYFLNPDEYIARHSGIHDDNCVEFKYYKDFREVWVKLFKGITPVKVFFDFLLIQINDKKELLCLKKANGEVLWHFSVSKLGRWIDMGEEREGKIIGPIVECNGVLIMGVSGNRIIGLEKNTGKLLWNNHYPVSGSSYLVYNDEAYTCNESFCILNPHSGEEKTLFPFYSVFDKYKAQAYGKRLITDKYIINIGQLDCIVMVFDKKSGEVVWRHEMYPSKKTGRRGITLKGDILDPVQYNQGKLYVLTSDKNLHVFDVEESIG